LKPVSVSAYGCPCAVAILARSDDDTIEQAYVPVFPADSR
jgi:hypothetical protein